MNITVDISDTFIETERLVLRPWKESDLSALYEYASVDGVGEAAGWRHHESIDVSRNVLQSFIEQKNVFALVKKINVKVVGSLSFHCSWASDTPKYAHLHSTDIGFVLSRDYWGRGLMPEAVMAALGYCFSTLGLDTVTCSHFDGNHQSQRVIEKCGFTFAGKSSFYSQQLGTVVEEMRYLKSG